MEEYNKQASEFIFRENNANGRVDADTIDLHGQFVEEAEEILEERIKYAKAHGQTHLHVYVRYSSYSCVLGSSVCLLCSIVGKGNHSANHVQKIKPRVEQVCQELGLQYATEENAGRMYVNLTGGAADMPSSGHHASHQYPGQQQQSHQQPHQQQQQQPDEIEQIVNAVLPRIMRKLEKACCVVM